MKPTGGPFGILNGLLVKFGLSRFDNGGLITEFMLGNRRSRQPSFNPSTGDNTQRIPWALRDNPEDQGIPEEEKEIPRSPERRKKSPPESSDSSSSDDEQPPQFRPEQKRDIAIMTKPVTRLIELSVPIYAITHHTGLYSYYSMNEDNVQFCASVSILENINMISTPPTYQRGQSNEYINMSKCYRNVRINKIALSFYADMVNTDTFKLLPPISLGITADKPLKYNNPNFIEDWYMDNYYHDNNIMFQVYSKRHDTPFNVYSMSDKNIETTTGSINSWTDTSTFHLNSLRLNLGCTARPVKDVAAYVVHRIGVVTILLECEFANPHTSLGF